MTNKNLNFLKTRLGIFALTYLGLATILIILAFMNKAANFDTIGSYMIKTGAVAFIICVLIFKRGSERILHDDVQSSYYRNSEHFKKVRFQETHMRLVIKQIIFASILLAITGLLMIVTVGN